MKEVRIVSDEELKKRKATNIKILKFGCLPIALLFGLIILITSIGGGDVKIDNTGESFDAKREVNNFCLMSIDELSQKYGKPSISEFEGNKDYTWTLNKEKGVKAIVFTEKGKEKSTVVRFFNVHLGDLFWDKLGWDKNNLDFNKVGQYVVVSNLQGIDEAMYKLNLETLNVKLTQDRDKNNFGKINE